MQGVRFGQGTQAFLAVQLTVLCRQHLGCSPSIAAPSPNLSTHAHHPLPRAVPVNMAPAALRPTEPSACRFSNSGLIDSRMKKCRPAPRPSRMTVGCVPRHSLRQPPCQHCVDGLGEAWEVGEGVGGWRVWQAWASSGSTCR